jgi:hypothetical protein
LAEALDARNPSGRELIEWLSLALRADKFIAGKNGKSDGRIGRL